MLMSVEITSWISPPPAPQNGPEIAIQGLHSSFDIPNSSFLRPPHTPTPLHV